MRTSRKVGFLYSGGNMSLELFIKGFIIGLSIAAPVGPIGLLIIKRTLEKGWLTGLISGLGAATADLLYGSIAAFGLSIIISSLLGVKGLLSLVGGVFLIYLGVKTVRDSLKTSYSELEPAAASDKEGLVKAYLSVLVLTITNPMTILSFLAIFAGVGSESGEGSIFSALLIVIGVFIGSFGWWLFLCLSVDLIRSKITPKVMRGISVGSGMILTAFGVRVIYQLFLSSLL